MYTLTFWWRTHGQARKFSRRAFLPADSEALQSFLNGETIVLLVRADKSVSSLALSGVDLGEELWTLLDRRTPHENVGDTPAAKVLVNSFTNKPARPIDALQAGWANRLERELGRAIRFFSAA